ncbi:hypothetical protein GWI33_012393, partial [Rhynchophorus ferrugineus]
GISSRQPIESGSDFLGRVPDATRISPLLNRNPFLKVDKNPTDDKVVVHIGRKWKQNSIANDRRFHLNNFKANYTENPTAKPTGKCVQK